MRTTIKIFNKEFTSDLCFAFMSTSAWTSSSPKSLPVDEIHFIPHSIFFYATCHTMIMMKAKAKYVLTLISNY